MSSLKLDIGSGTRPHKDCKTIDIEPKYNPDYLGDFRKMEFKDVELIRAHHILEHFSREESRKVLKQWWDWLRVGGELIIETPDFEEICYHFLNQPR